jgi:hypothetical protein
MLNESVDFSIETDRIERLPPLLTPPLDKSNSVCHRDVLGA